MKEEPLGVGYKPFSCLLSFAQSCLCISQLLIIVFQRQILRREEGENPHKGPLPWSSVVTQELAVTLVPGKLTAVDTEGSSGPPSIRVQAPRGTGGASPGFLSQAVSPRSCAPGTAVARCAPPCLPRGTVVLLPGAAPLVLSRICAPLLLLFCLLFVSNSFK